MIFLEIAMIVIGLGFVFFSYRMSSDKKEMQEEMSQSQNDVAVHSEEALGESVRLQTMLESFTTKAENMCDDLEDRMSQLSNEKIMGLSEYSDHILDKIQKNHEEVVFLYDMMNDKQEELKLLIHTVDKQKASLQDESAKEYQRMKEQESLLDEMKKAVETDFALYQSRQGEFRREFEHLRRDYLLLEEEIERSQERLQQQEGLPVKEKTPSATEGLSDEEIDNELLRLLLEGDMQSDLDEAETSSKDTAQLGNAALSGQGAPAFDSSVFDEEVARIVKEEEKANASQPKEREPVSLSSGYVPIAEQPKAENHNSEIISLYKSGRSILEISKMLSLGQGEVKFVIDLYNAR